MTTQPHTIDRADAARSETNCRPRLGSGVRLLLGAVVIVAAFAFTASQAEAFSFESRGSNGRVDVPDVFGSRVPTIQAGPRYTGVVWADGLATDASSVYRSPVAAGAQIVTLDHYVARWDGYRWVQSPNPDRQQVTISANAVSAVVPAWAYYPGPGGTFSVGTVVTWWTSAGQWLGNIVINRNAYGDYGCRIAADVCRTGNGWVQLLRPY